MPLMVADNYGSELRRLNDRFCAATGIRRTDCVLDIGCGAGQTSRNAARAAVAGKVLGVDVSEQLLERARVLRRPGGGIQQSRACGAPRGAPGDAGVAEP